MCCTTASHVISTCWHFLHNVHIISLQRNFFIHRKIKGKPIQRVYNQHDKVYFWVKILLLQYGQRYFALHVTYSITVKYNIFNEKKTYPTNLCHEHRITEIILDLKLVYLRNQFKAK